MNPNDAVKFRQIMNNPKLAEQLMSAPQAQARYKKIMGKAKRALKPGGMLVLDGFTSEQYVDFEESEMVSYERSGFWSDSPYACIQRNFKYDEAKIYLEQYVVITEDDCECFNIWNQEFTKDSLTKELQDAGFSEFRYYDDISGKSYTGDSKTICVVVQ